MKCECMGWERVDGIDLQYPGDDLHHTKCPKFSTEKRPRMFYYEEAEDCWAPWPTGSYRGSYALSYLECMDDGDTMEIQFSRRDMTDKEFTELPTG